MSHVRRAVAWCTTLTAAFSFMLFLTSPAHAADPASQATADAAVAWLKTQQQSDGGFELAMFPGFETRDAALAIAEDAQTGTVWSTSEAVAALAALHFGGTPAGATPLDALDDFGATVTTAGAAAKTIVLSAAPLGLDPSAFDPAGDGSPVNLVALLDAGCGADTASFGPAFSDTLYAVLAKRLVCGTPPAAALATVRGAQQANGGWNFNGDPTGTDLDPDTTALAVEALVAGGADASDPAVHAALGFFAANQQVSGAWQSFGADDPNSTSLAILAITAAGYDVDSSCWRDTADPAAAGTAYPSPTAWLRSRQLANPPADAGRIASPNDAFGVNTFATSQTVEGLLRTWLPITTATAQTCPVPVTPPTTTPGGSGATAPVATEAVAVAVTPRFTG